MNNISTNKKFFCPNCSSDSVKILRPFFFNKDFELYTCKNCDLSFKDNTKTDKEFDLKDGDYYLKKKVGDKVNERYKRHFSKRAKNHLDYIEKFISNEFIKTALDVGCGAGIFMKHLETKGWLVEGIEPDPHMFDYAKNKLNLDVHKKLFSEWQAKRKFGLIYLSHILDDLPNLKEVLSKIRSSLEEDGLLFIEVPNLSSKFRINFEKEAELMAGKYFFSINSLKDTLERSGFKILNVKTFRLVHLNSIFQILISPIMFLLHFMPGKYKPCLRIIAKKANE